uniref:Sorting nexin-13 n=1 Tax=Noccaea caerulescens TaxID=107243 RepID=A0A1J3J137_NOCCA
MKAMETIQDLIEEAKVRTVWWGLCIFSVTYFLTHTSKSMWMNLPMAILILCGLRILFNQIDFRWKVRPTPRQSQSSYIDKKQLSLNDPRLSTVPPPPRWKKKIDSPVVEAAINDFIDKILNDFVINLWYSLITPDREAPELIRGVIMDALGEISVRVKEINIVDLVTRDIVDLIGDHLETFRRNHAAIGTDVMKTLSSEERDERLKYHLMTSGELYPALISPESEYKVLQKIVAGILSVVLRPREAQCPLVRTIAREIVTCLVIQPLLNLASPERINEVIEIVINLVKEGNFEQFSGEEQHVNPASLSAFDNQAKNMNLTKVNEQKTPSKDDERHPEMRIQQHSADWARMLEVATQRRTEVLTPENLENMWTKGRNYKKKEYKKSLKKGSLASNQLEAKQKSHSFIPGTSTGAEEKAVANLPPKASIDKESQAQMADGFSKSVSYEGRRHIYEVDVRKESPSDGNKNRLKRSNSTSDLTLNPDPRLALLGVGEGPLITEFYTTDLIKHNENYICDNRSPNMLPHKESQHCPKLKSRVIGAYFEKLASKSFAVYSIAVTDTENKTWFVKRRYSNFERLHRQLKEIPNYNLQLPPKRIFSSSTEDAFVHRRCIQLDKFLQDLLSIANVAEQHEVWDFLSASSKNYSFGKSSSVMKTLAVNVDDAMDDIVRQFKGVSDGLMRKVVGSPLEESDNAPARHMSWSVHDINTQLTKGIATESMNSSISDNEDIDKLGESTQGEGRLDSEANGWHSDNELDSKYFPPRVVRRLGEPENFPSDMENDSKAKSEVRGSPDSQHADLSTSLVQNPTGMPPEWMPPNVSVPILNLVDKVFQLNRRGWLRRQVFWISKQILQLVMEDAVDDWLLREVRWLRSEDTVAQGIRWAQDILWPDGVFFTRVSDDQEASDETDPSEKTFQMAGQLGGMKVTKPSSFEQQLEAARRAREIKNFLFDGAPTALVSLVGHKQYRRCARDIFYFTQSNVCIKQLTFAILELLLRTVFPELQDLLRDIRENPQSRSE